MKEIFRLLLLIIAIITCYTCEKDSLEFASEIAGVVITFDDDFDDEWLMADSMLSKYDWKATFNVAYIDKFSETRIENLKYLETKGHEIGGHSITHPNALIYWKNIPLMNILIRKLYL